MKMKTTLFSVLCVKRERELNVFALMSNFSMDFFHLNIILAGKFLVSSSWLKIICFHMFGGK